MKEMSSHRCIPMIGEKGRKRKKISCALFDCIKICAGFVPRDAKPLHDGWGLYLLGIQYTPPSHDHDSVGQMSFLSFFLSFLIVNHFIITLQLSHMSELCLAVNINKQSQWARRHHSFSFKRHDGKHL